MGVDFIFKAPQNGGVDYIFPLAKQFPKPRHLAALYATNRVSRSALLEIKWNPGCEVKAAVNADN
jgi:hypothetical protein